MRIGCCGVQTAWALALPTANMSGAAASRVRRGVLVLFSGMRFLRAMVAGHHDPRAIDNQATREGPVLSPVLKCVIDFRQGSKG